MKSEIAENRTANSVNLQQGEAVQKIKIDFNHVIDKIRPVHNIGRMPSYEPNDEINTYFAKANMTSCRTHDINVTDMYLLFPDFDRDPDDENAYCFEQSDKVIAAIAAAGMEPFFRLGISYSDPVKQRALLQPPTDYDKWARVCEHIILHYNHGWAKGFYYNITYWEIWNEPDNEDVAENNVFWQGTPEAFYRLYDVAATYLKGKFPEIKIGGFGSCGFYALNNANVINTGSSPRFRYFVSFFEDFLAYISVHKPPMDFFSWHSYTTTENNARYIDYVRQKLQQAGYGHTEIVCNEWNYNPTENDKIDRRYGANQTSVLLLFQNKGINMAHYYCAIYLPTSVHAGMFVKERRPSSAYYGFAAFGRLYKMGNQVEIKSADRKDLYAVAAKGECGQAVLLANISESQDMPIELDAGDYVVEQCMTVNKNCEWVEIPLPSVIESGSVLFVTFQKSATTP